MTDKMMNKPGTPGAPGVPPDQDQRELILTRLDRNMLVEAAAGTGKTASMVGRMVALLRTGTCENVRTLAAVTFTRKAAAELRSRFQVGLEQAVREAEGEEKARLERALADIEHCFTGTIHSFCGRLLRERPVEAGVDVSFVEIEAEADGRLRKEAWGEFCALTIASDPHGFLDELDRLGLSLGDLESAFLRFADFPDVDTWPLPWDGAPLPDLAPAGLVLQEYLSHMRAITPLLPEDTGNDKLIPAYHRLPRIASHYNDLSQPDQLMELLEEFDRSLSIVQKIWMQNGAFTKEEAKAEKENWDVFRSKIAAPLLRIWRVHRYAPLMQVLFAAREVYDRMRHERGWLNFQDLLMRAAALLREKPHVRRYFNERFTHILVDEFQDTDPIQAEVMLLLTAADPDECDWHRCVPRPGSLFVVGDPKQSIYRFRRADIVTYNEVKEIILSGGNTDGGAEGGLLVRLSANFRSTSTLTGWVNHVFQPKPDESGDAGENPGPVLCFPAQETEVSPAYVKLLPGRADGNSGELAGLQVLYIDDDYSRIDDAVAWEADLISRTIRHALDQGLTITRTSRELEQGVPEAASPSDFMIITRTRKHLSLYARALQTYGIPHRVTGGAALNEIEELKLLHACLRAVSRPDDPVSLVAALRSELFGVSDTALYAFKQAGGRFSYRATVPEGLESEDAEAIEDAFAHLLETERFISHLPPLAALERISGGLGLPVLSATHPGGDVQAGSLAKALEVLRGLQSEVWTTSQLVEYLETLVNREETFDGISARSGNRPAVRVMNLHKVKGLEAPVVFLAAPAGEWDHGVELHIDRSGPRILGYMGIRGGSDNFGSVSLLACPAGWDEAAELEKLFLDAEALRLRYVAATRAGSALIITQRTSEGKNRRNPWKYFLAHLSCEPELTDPGAQAAPVVPQVSLSTKEVEEARDGILSRLARCEVPTFDARAAKEYALAQPLPAKDGPGLEKPAAPPAVAETGTETPAAGEGEHGVEWGTVIHLLLEAAAREPGADLEKLAAAALPESGLDPELAPAAAALASGVLDSEIWRRSLKSEHRLSEVPFHYLLDEDNDELPVLLRGSVDLAFRENGGWVLVDYKTDLADSDAEMKALARRYAPQLRLYARAWEACTGETVKEMLLYFTRGGIAEYIKGG